MVAAAAVTASGIDFWVMDSRPFCQALTLSAFSTKSTNRSSARRQLMAQSRHAQCAEECPLWGQSGIANRCLPISIYECRPSGINSRDYAEAGAQAGARCSRQMTSC
jgi:hypothetical protein